MMKRWLLALLILALPLAALAEEPTYRLTVNFVFEDGSQAAEAQVLQLAAGAEYAVEPPRIDGYEPDPKTVTGTMPEGDAQIDVTYRKAAETPEPGETTAPDEPVSPDETPVPEGLTLTIRYVTADGVAAAQDYVQYGLQEGDAYDVESPRVEGMTADQQRVTGVMGAENVEIVVTYTAGSFPDGMPGGGFPGGSRPSGSMSGMPGMAGEQQGPSVTPGEALSDIHTAGDGSMALYGSVALTGDEFAPLATVEGEALAIALLADGEYAAFEAQIDGDAVVLSGEAGVWQIGGDALRALADSGYVQLTLVSGEYTAQLPTEGFASGYAWDRLMMQGLPSAAFAYEIDPAQQIFQLTVADTVYDAAEIFAEVQFGVAAAQE